MLSLWNIAVYNIQGVHCECLRCAKLCLLKITHWNPYELRSSEFTAYITRCVVMVVIYYYLSQYYWCSKAYISHHGLHTAPSCACVLPSAPWTSEFAWYLLELAPFRQAVTLFVTSAGITNIRSPFVSFVGSRVNPDGVWMRTGGEAEESTRAVSGTMFCVLSAGCWLLLVTSSLSSRAPRREARCLDNLSRTPMCTSSERLRNCQASRAHSLNPARNFELEMSS